MPGETPLDPATLDALRGFSSPTICNAIETFRVRDAAEGFMEPEIRCVLPGLGRMVGYACTATIGTRVPAGPKPRVSMPELWEHVASIPEPRILVVGDVDAPHPLGSFWGEVNANIFKAQGAIGVVTNGGVRDLEEVEALGFHYFAAAVVVSHAHMHLVDVGGPVEVGGLRVRPGELLHGDVHGVTQVPPEIAARVPEAARRIEEQEREIIRICQAPGFSPEKLMEAFRRGAASPARSGERGGEQGVRS